MRTNNVLLRKMRTLKTAEEIREKARERAARWRAKNKWVHRERVAALYGRSKAQQHTDNVTDMPREEEVEQTVVDDTLTYDLDPTDARTDAEKKQDREQAEYWAKRRGRTGVSGPQGKDPGVKPRGDALSRRKAFEALKAAVEGKKVVSQKGGRGVEVRLEGI
jgi:hypothetical protein